MALRAFTVWCSLTYRPCLLLLWKHSLFPTPTSRSLWGLSGTCLVQVSFKLAMKQWVTLPPTTPHRCWNYRHAPPHLAKRPGFLNFIFTLSWTFFSILARNVSMLLLPHDTCGVTKVPLSVCLSLSLSLSLCLSVSHLCLCLSLLPSSTCTVFPALWTVLWQNCSVSVSPPPQVPGYWIH